MQEAKNPSTEFFPHDDIRKQQDELISDVYKTIKSGRSLIAHAPTGLGKTAATLAPAISVALKEKLTIFFLTSRHTQHLIVVETLKKIKEKHGLDIKIADIIGKKWMCLIEGMTKLPSSEFSEFCKDMMKDKKCGYYVKSKGREGKPSPDASLVLEKAWKEGPFHIDEIIRISKERGVCPYEIATFLSKDANIIITDYYYIFNSSIRDNFFKKIDKELKDCILIVDEGHNLPERIRELATSKLSSFIISRAQKEAKKFGLPQINQKINRLSDALEKLSYGLGDSLNDFMVASSMKNQNRNGNEKLVTKEEFVLLAKEALGDYEESVAEFYFAAEDIRLSQKQSFIGSIAAFLESWDGQDDGFTRIISVGKSRRTNQRVTTLTYRCLDPSLITKDIFSSVHSSILMSGTLTPTAMYHDILGFPENTTEKSYISPFPRNNRLNLVLPITTTKFSARTEGQFQNIARITSDIANLTPGNVVVFFPSYAVKDQVAPLFEELCKKTSIIEHSELSKQDKKEMIEKFVGYKDNACLLAVIGGSFNEGIDIPNNIIKCIIIVGLPLQVPDLETKQLIDYFQEKFHMGWEYGYIYPAFNKALQGAGRCIRSGTDKGLVVFLDERYTWPNYFRCFPLDQQIKISKDYLRITKEFFNLS